MHLQECCCVANIFSPEVSHLQISQVTNIGIQRASLWQWPCESKKVSYSTFTADLIKRFPSQTNWVHVSVSVGKVGHIYSVVSVGHIYSKQKAEAIHNSIYWSLLHWTYGEYRMCIELDVLVVANMGCEPALTCYNATTTPITRPRK